MSFRIGIILSICLFLIYGLILVTNSLEGFPEKMHVDKIFPYLADKPVGEDGYYMLTVAWNMANGHGIVYNYNKATTGIQPLSTFIYAGLAWVCKLFGGNKWLFIRYVLVFGIINLVVFSHIIGTIARALLKDRQSSRNLAFISGFLITLFNFSLFRLFTYGLETGIYLTLFSTCILYTITTVSSPFKKIKLKEAIVLGILFGLTGLSRIDFGVVLLFFLSICVLLRYIKLKWAVLIGGIAIIVLTPWFFYVHKITSSWIPSSGLAQSSFITTDSAFCRIQSMVISLIGHLTPFLYVDRGHRYSALIIGFAVITFFLTIYITVYTGLLSTIRKHFPVFLVWFASVILLIILYPVYFWAIHFYSRYSAPIFIFFGVFIAILIAEIINKLKVKKIDINFTLCLIPISFFVWAFLSLHTGRVGNTHTVTAGYVMKNFPNKKVGVFQSGVIGFFNINVINLDGKIDHLALCYGKNKKLNIYIDKEGIDILVDWPSSIYGSLDKNYLDSNWKLREVRIPNDISICLERK